MTTQLTIDALKEMRFSGMAAEFQLQLDDPASYAHFEYSAVKVPPIRTTSTGNPRQ